LSFQLDYFPVLEVKISRTRAASQLKHFPVFHIGSRIEIDVTSQHQVPFIFPNLVFVPLTLPQRVVRGVIRALGDGLRYGRILHANHDFEPNLE